MAEKWATDSGTDKYFKWVSLHSSKKKRFDDLTVSSLGAGTYLGPSDDAADKHYEQTLLQAALGGINFFDTAINYRNQRSERVLGKVIRELTCRGVLREQLVIASKGGYLPFEGSFEEYVRTHYLDTGIIENKDIIADSHCMTAGFLDDQISASLKNMGLQCLDLYYLHNPEIQLPEVGEEEFYRRIRAAFSLFEQKVQEKKIRRYGIATWNGFRSKKEILQISKIFQCAKEVAGDAHHFRAIQMPFNLVMLEAVKQKKLFAFAAENKLAIMTSAALMQGKVKQLCTRIFEELPPAKSRILQALQFVLSTPQISTAFCGMKTLSHWEENKQVLQEANWTPDQWAKACKTLGLKKED